MTTMFQKNTNDIPIQKVVAMRKQNLSDNQIIQTLQNEGYNSQNVLEALDMADMGKVPPDVNSGNIPQTPMNNSPQSISNLSPPNSPQNNFQNMPPPNFPQNNFQIQPNYPPKNMPGPKQDNSKESDSDIEELIEAIIDEKWAQVEKDINRVLEWKESVDEKLGAMQQEIKTIKKNFDDLHKAIIGKIGDYDANILNVGTQLKAMEQVFSKVLPTFTDNVTELNRIADKLKYKDK